MARHVRLRVSDRIVERRHLQSVRRGGRGMIARLEHPDADVADRCREAPFESGVRRGESDRIDDDVSAHDRQTVDGVRDKVAVGLSTESAQSTARLLANAVISRRPPECSTSTTCTGSAKYSQSTAEPRTKPPRIARRGALIVMGCAAWSSSEPIGITPARAGASLRSGQRSRASRAHRAPASDPPEAGRSRWRSSLPRNSDPAAAANCEPATGRAP